LFVQALYDLMDDFYFSVDFDDVRRRWATLEWPARIMTSLERCKASSGVLRIESRLILTMLLPP
jgi:hypothetical protein